MFRIMTGPAALEEPRWLRFPRAKQARFFCLLCANSDHQFVLSCEIQLGIVAKHEATLRRSGSVRG